MGKRFAAGVWICVVVVSALVATPAVMYAQGETVTVTQVKPEAFPRVALEVEVATADGTPVEGLKAGDFHIYENGQEQAGVTTYPLYQSPTPLSLVLLIDCSGSMAGEPMDQAKEAAKLLVSRMRTLDRVAIFGFASEVAQISPFSDNRRSLSDAIDGLRASGDTVLYDVLLQSAAQLRGVKGSKAVILLTDGQDNGSTATMAQALEAVRSEGVPVYTVGLGGGPGYDILDTISGSTHGRSYKAPTPADLSYVFRLISDQIRNRYLLSYESKTTGAVGSPVTVDLTIDLGDQALKARAGYYLPAVVTGSDAGGPLKTVRAGGTGLPSWWPFAAGGLGAGAMAILVLGVVVASTQSAKERRLRQFVAPYATTGVPTELPSPASHFFAPLVQSMAALVERFTPKSNIERTALNLVRAGNPFGWGVREFLALKLASGIVLGIISFFLGRNNILIGLLMTVVGFYLPGVWLGLQIKSRKAQILRILPDALDLLTICVESGLSFMGALLEVCNRWDNPLSTEFATALSEMKMGKSRRDALRDMAHRTDLQEVSVFVGALIQADQLGMSIAKTLTLQADQMRIRRRQIAEETAHKAAIKMLFPLVFLIFPALFVVILGPSVPIFLEAFGGP